MFAAMLAGDYHRKFIDELKTIYAPGEAHAIARLVFAKLLHTEQTSIIANPAHTLTTGETNLLQEALQQLMQHTPVQYVLGEAHFYDLSFRVSPAVLIPRPETEELVKMAIDFIQENKVADILDIGTGSGCIPIVVKKNCPATAVTAIDVHKPALALAKENGRINETVINWMEMDFLEHSNWQKLSRYDVIISNPPYIPNKEKEKLDKNVTAHEPAVALFVPDDDPLIFYRNIADFAVTRLSLDGKIFLEVHQAYAKAVQLLLAEKGYEATLIKDLSGNDRIVTAIHSR